MRYILNASFSGLKRKEHLRKCECHVALYSEWREGCDDGGGEDADGAADAACKLMSTKLRRALVLKMSSNERKLAGKGRNGAAAV